MTNRNSQRNAPIAPDRVRKIGKDGFAFIPNRFFTLQQNVWVSSGSGSRPSWWYSAVSMTS